MIEFATKTEHVADIYNVTNKIKKASKQQKKY